MVKVGIVGFGYMGRFHLNKSRQCEGIEVIAAYDIDSQKLKNAEEEGLKVARSLDELLKMEEINLIVVSTPNDSHKEIAIAALKAGKNVLCEKPATMNAAEAEEIIAVAEQEGRFFTVHQNRRWDTDYLLVKKVLQDGSIGNFTTINSWVYGQRGVCFGWRADPAKGGGMLFDWGIHLMDQMLDLYSGHKVTRVFGRLESILTPAVDDFFEVKMFFDHGVCANVSVGTFALQETPRWFVFGDRGTLKIKDFSWENGQMARIRKNVEGFDSVFTKSNLGPSRTMAPLAPEMIEKIPLPEVENQPLAFYQNLINAVEGKESPIVTHGHVIRDMKLIDAVFESDRKRQVIDISL